MKKQIIKIWLVILVLMLVLGCKETPRIYSVAMLDRPISDDPRMEVVQDMFEKHGVSVIDEDSVESAIEKSYLTIQLMRLCASRRSDRLDGAVALGERLEVDAVIYSTMPGQNIKFQDRVPCMMDSLITLYLVDPPTVIYEAHDYGELLGYLETLNWDEIVKPPPIPEDFIVGLDEKLEFADLEIKIESNSPREIRENKFDDFPLESEKLQANRENNRQEENSKRDSTESKFVESNFPWKIVISEGPRVIHSKRFERRIVERVGKHLKYDVSVNDEFEEPRFKLLLTDLR